MTKRNKSSQQASAEETIRPFLDDGQINAAWEKIRSCLEIAPNDVRLLHKAARLCRQCGQLEEAKRYYYRALTLQPQDAELLNGLGLTFYDQGYLPEAEKYYRHALALYPGYAACHSNLGALLQKLDRHQEAAKAYEQALQYDLYNIEARFGLSSALACLQDIDGAEIQLRRLLQLAPHDARAQTFLGMVMLQKGEFVEGWQLYRARYAHENPCRTVTLPEINLPYWQGESLDGKSILIVPEQGFGDNLQFCRYVTRLKPEKGARAVYMICPPELHPLLYQLSGIDWRTLHAPLQASYIIDYWTMLLDLPRHFLNSNDPFGVMPPYLQADVEQQNRWQLEPDAKKPFHVGVVWKGSLEHANDNNRSLENLTVLKPLWSVPGIRWISLQKGHGEKEALNPASDQPIHAMGHKMENFADTAALMAQMDLVITVDTAVAHLAGSLNIPCWVMIPSTGKDWRWLRGRDDSPWYPAMRLFHRKPATGWDETVLRILDTLETWVTEQPVNPTRSHTLIKDLRSQATIGQDNTTATKNILCPKPSAQGLVRSLLNSGQMEAGLNKILSHLQTAPHDLWFLHEAARLCRQSGRLEEAKGYYQRALALLPDNARLLNGLGVTLFDEGNFHEAEHYYRCALAQFPQYTACHNNLGVLLQKLGRYQEAVAEYQEVLKQESGHMEARLGLGSALAYLQDLDGAETWLRQVLQQAPHDTRTQTALGMVLLQKGAFAEGWQLYRGRYATDNPDRFVFPPKTALPYWQGESLVGKGIMVCPEQGFGDNLQFSRYVMRLKREKGARAVFMICSFKLYPLFSQLPDVTWIPASNDQSHSIEGVHCWTMLLDLPRHFLDTHEPFGMIPPYLRTDFEQTKRWQLEADPEHPFNVGVIWKGSPKHFNDKNRSLENLAVLKPLWTVPHIRWISLQKGSGELEALNSPEDQPILAMGHRLGNFADTAALMAQMDLVITVDTATAHLAGSLNIPCWVLLPFISPDWRWLKGQDDSPWYPSMRLFRQKPDTSWDETILRMREALEAWAEQQLPTAS